MNPILFSVLSVLILTLINGLFAGAEIAFVSIDKREMIEEADSGDKKANHVLNILKEPDSFLSTIQIAITLAGFLNSASAASSLTEPISQAISWLPPSVITVLITLVISYITLVLGELVPKQIAMQLPNKYSKGISGLVYYTNKLFRPIIVLLNVSTKGFLKLLPIDFDTDQPEYTRDELRYVLNQAQEEQSIDNDELKMLENILKLNGRRASDIKTHRLDVEMLDLDAYEKKEDLLPDLLASQYSRLPVYQDSKDNIIGILHQKVITQDINASKQFDFDKNLMPPLEVYEHVFLDDLLESFKSAHTHMAILHDEYGGFEGIVTLEDVIEEIVGNIEDETDRIVDEVSEKSYNQKMKAHSPS